MLPHLKVESNKLGECFGGRGRKKVLLVGVTNYSKDDPNLKCTDLYLNSLEFQELCRLTAETQAVHIFMQGRYSPLIEVAVFFNNLSCH